MHQTEPTQNFYSSSFLSKAIAGIGNDTSKRRTLP